MPLVSGYSGRTALKQSLVTAKGRQGLPTIPEAGSRRKESANPRTLQRREVQGGLAISAVAVWLQSSSADQDSSILIAGDSTDATSETMSRWINSLSFLREGDISSSVTFSNSWHWPKSSREGLQYSQLRTHLKCLFPPNQESKHNSFCPS